MITATNRRLLIGLYVCIAFLFWMSLFLYIPTLSTYIQHRTENLAMVGVVLSMYGLWQALARIPLGLVSDWLAADV